MKQLWLLTLALFPLGIIHAQTPPTPPPAPFAPLDYFDTNCARCHGPYGSFYGASFGKTLKDDAALKAIVKAMCDGPGNAPLNDKDLETLTDFHRALRDGKPYVVLVATEKSETGLTLSGEATPDSNVTIDDGSKTTDLPLDGHHWKTTLPADFNLAHASLRAVKDGKESVIELGAQ